MLIIGVVGYTEPVTGRHNLLFAQTGDFRDGYFIPSSHPLQMLDFGTDFYALQTWGEEDARTGFAWLYNWATQKTSSLAIVAKCPYRVAFILTRNSSFA